jgi:3-hydroxyacyl-[acyl-carrier-protein] dehydratase
MDLPLNYQDIIKLLPHRYPFLLVDRITELEPGKRIVGIKNVSANEQFFQGHFPGNPVMPGVLIIEAMAQVGGVLSRITVCEGSDMLEAPTVYFMSIDKVKFRRPVVPGDQLKFELTPLRTGSRVWKMEGKAFVDGILVAEAEFMAQIGL